MAVSIGINVGTACTSGIFSFNNQTQAVKVDTIPQKPVNSLTKCIEEGAKKLGFPSAQSMLQKTITVRISAPFIGPNTLHQKTGPKLGLIVTKGFEDTLYATRDTNITAIHAIISSDMVVGIDEEMDMSGRPIRTPEEEAVREGVKILLEQGAEGVVVSLQRAPLNPENERMIRQIIETEYPAHYLGAVPTFLSTEAGATLDDFCRTNAALLNAYCQRDTAKFLYEAEDAIKQLGHIRPLLVLHTEGGVAQVCKSTPLTCIHSDQAANYLTLAQIGKLCGEQEIVALDMGGSGIKACLLKGNKYIYNRTPTIDGIPLKTPILDFAPLAKGGHCVAEVNNNAIRLGVETLEPACYGARGDRPTVTDACVTLGLIARNDLQSVKAMNVEKARQVITDALARPLGISPEEAAHMVLSEVKAAAVLLLKALVENKEVNMEHVTLFSLGGMSGIFCCDVAQQLGISRIYCPPMSWAFSALGCLFAPVLHSYEMCAEKVIRGSASPTDRDWFNGIVQGLENIACRDMMGEGFSADKLSFALELEASTNSSQGVIEAPRVLETEGNMASLFESFAKEVRQSAPIDELTIELFRLRAAGPMNPYQFSRHESANKDPQKAFREEMDSYLGNALEKVAVYRREMLECGNVVTGPALIQSQGDTVFVPSGKAYSVDAFLGGVIE